MTRRNFINGTLVAAGASMIPFGCSDSILGNIDPLYYPPALTGLRGNHDGSNIHAHGRALTNRIDWGSTTDLQEQYDLVVVGGGISGLAAAYFYQQRHGRDKKILILDNHDDFGGHAKRNEHKVGDKTFITNGGSQSLQSPHGFSDTVKELFADLNVDLDRFKTAYDKDFCKRNNLGAVTYFNKEKFGEDKVVKHSFCNYPWYIEGLKKHEMSPEDAVNQAPLSDIGKAQLLKVMKGGLHSLNVPQADLDNYISTHSYFDYLTDTMGVTDADVLDMARVSCSDYSGSGSDTITIGEALDCGALGFDPLEWKDVIGEEAYEKYLAEHGYVYDERDEYIYHFPDGNATIARLLVRHMIPKVADGVNSEDIVLAQFDYSQLDKSSNRTRLRLNSTAVNVMHSGDPSSSNDVDVTYINNNKSCKVRARGVVMACYNNMIPHIVKGMPEVQSNALRQHVKIPLQYTSVGLKNWRAMKEMEIGMAMSPGNMHQVVMMDFPVSMGGYEFTKSPDDPCLIQMVGCPFGSTLGAPPRVQYKEVRYKMLGMEFKDYETEIRSHLSGMLPSSLFDFDRDVSSISVNRWAHGYTYGGSALFDPDMHEYAKIGRQRFGRIAIANIDSALSSYAHVAIDQAWRAVNELG